MQSSFTSKQLDRRANSILSAARSGRMAPTGDTLVELVEITEAISDQPVKPVVIARLTLTRQDNTRIVVEIHRDVRFASFYRYYSQQGNKRSTKSHVRTGGRHEAASLEGVAINFKTRERADNPSTNIRLKIFLKREYRRLIAAGAGELGLSRMSSLPIYSPVPARHS
jgi:hypothetical protein